MSSPIYMLTCSEYLGKWKYKNDKLNQNTRTSPIAQCCSWTTSVSVKTHSARPGNANVTSSTKQPTHEEVQQTKSQTISRCKMKQLTHRTTFRTCYSNIRYSTRPSGKHKKKRATLSYDVELWGFVESLWHSLTFSCVQSAMWYKLVITPIKYLWRD